MEQKKTYTMSAADRTVVLTRSVYTGRDKANVENHLKFGSICHKYAICFRCKQSVMIRQEEGPV